MSTKIFDAWRINSTDIGELVKLGNEIREVQKKSFVDAVYNSLDFCQLAIIFAKKSWWTATLISSKPMNWKNICQNLIFYI